MKFLTKMWVFGALGHIIYLLEPNSGVYNIYLAFVQVLLIIGFFFADVWRNDKDG